jgi:hypothetical protein
MSFFAHLYLFSFLEIEGGGYSYRLCKIQEGVIPPVTEECFQKTPLKFASDKQWLQVRHKTEAYYFVVVMNNNSGDCTHST